jgi:prevent-host-death family protein
VGSNPFRDRLGYWLERVAKGDEILVTYRGKPRVRLTPVCPEVPLQLAEVPPRLAAAPP